MQYGNMLVIGNTTLTYDPTLAKHAATKSYVDNTAIYMAGMALNLTAKQFSVNVSNASIGVVSNALVVRSTATNGQVLRSVGTAGNEATWGALDLTNANSVTGALGIANGGTGAVTAAAARTALATPSFYRTTFTSANVTAGLLSVTHALGNKIVSLQITDNTDKIIQPDDVTMTNTTTSIVDLTTYGTITGTWNVIAVG
jgi:hypothetical protein